jgi:hypothetical protein
MLSIPRRRLFAESIPADRLPIYRPIGLAASEITKQQTMIEFLNPTASMRRSG